VGFPIQPNASSSLSPFVVWEIIFHHHQPLYWVSTRLRRILSACFAGAALFTCQRFCSVSFFRFYDQTTCYYAFSAEPPSWY
jgi:hypothetical protein